MPAMRKRQSGRRAQLEALRAELHDSERQLTLVGALRGFVGRLVDGVGIGWGGHGSRGLAVSCPGRAPESVRRAVVREPVQVSENLMQTCNPFITFTMSELAVIGQPGGFDGWLRRRCRRD